MCAVVLKSLRVVRLNKKIVTFLLKVVSQNYFQFVFKTAMKSHFFQKSFFHFQKSCFYGNLMILSWQRQCYRIQIRAREHEKKKRL